MNKKQIEEIDDIVYGLYPLFPMGYGMNRVSAIVWERIRLRLEKKRRFKI